MHNNNFSPYKLCDLRKPIYCLNIQIPASKKTSEKQFSKTPGRGAVKIAGKKPKEPTIVPRKNKTKNDFSASGDWIAVDGDDTEWYLAKIKSSQKVGDKEVFSTSNILTKVIGNLKHFDHGVSENNVKKVFEDGLFCQIKSPKASKRPKNVVFVKEFDEIEKFLNDKLSTRE